MRDAFFQKTTLPSGLRVLTERHEDVSSATVGIWIQAGAVYENDDERGVAHLLEHLVFKGARKPSGEKRNMTQIAAEMDLLGGGANAFTEREMVCYHVRVLSEHLPRAMSLLCDLVARPTLEEADLQLEKGVVIEEIKSIEDEPDELAADLFNETIYANSRWGHSILGTTQSVGAMGSEHLKKYLSTHYTPKNVLVSAVGDVQHEQVVKLAEKLLADLNPQENTAHREPPIPRVKSRHRQFAREAEQVHLCCGTRAYSAEDPRRFAAWLLDSVMTGGYSSRLFQEVREKRGLCYNIGPMSVSYRKTGFWAIETSVAPQQAKRVTDIIGRELRKVKTKGVGKAELKRAQEMSRINLLLSEESSSAQMNRIARNELYYGRQRSPLEVLECFMRVTPEEVQAVANDIFQPDTMNIAAVGPFAKGAEPLIVDVG